MSEIHHLIWLLMVYSLSFTEIYFTIAALFRPHGPVLQLYDTEETDVKPLHDFMLSLPKLDSKGLRVTVS